MTSLLSKIGFSATRLYALSIRNLATATGKHQSLFNSFNASSILQLTTASHFQGPREFVETEKIGGKKNVGLIKLNRPKALNALNDDLMRDINSALDEFEKDAGVGAMIITGNGKAFAAGKLNKFCNS